ncbi:MAG: MerR family transcriptional regulator [Candidatus Omnitrophota bacterium]
MAVTLVDPKNPQGRCFGNFKKIKAELFATSEERCFKASDVQKMAGLTYRQINDWDSKGALSNDRESSNGWRKFNLQEIFAMAVCKDVRDKFGVSIEVLEFLKSRLLSTKNDCFKKAIDYIFPWGSSAYLVTDLSSNVFVCINTAFGEMAQKGELDLITKEEHLIIIKLNPILRKILTAVNYVFPISNQVNCKFAEVFENWRLMKDASEMEIIDAIRSGNFSEVKIFIKNKKPQRMALTNKLSEKDKKELIEQLCGKVKTDSYDSLYIHRSKGDILRLMREESVLLGTEKS